MEGYLGTTSITMEEAEFKSKEEVALYYIGSYGQIDGSHHKQWVLDQVARILNGCELIFKMAKWDNGLEELRVTTGKPSDVYIQWVNDMKDGEDGPDSYGYDEGIAP
jgi:hypothetical protein